MMLAVALICEGRGWLVTVVNLVTMAAMTIGAVVAIALTRSTGRDAAGCNTSCSDAAVRPDAHPGHNNHTRAEPHVVFEDYGS